LKICLASNSAEEYSQTFVRDHISHLPGEVLPLLGDWPYLQHKGQFILPKRYRLGVRFSNRFPRWVTEGIRKVGENHLASFIKQAEVVLAEFAPMGASLVPPCRIAKVPLVVHFHGYDAYDRRTLEKYQKDYQEMFRSAAAFVVVSEAMCEQVGRLGAPREKVHFNPYGVDVLRFGPTDAGSNPPHFLAMGRFVEKKAHFLTILAFERALRQYHDIRLSIAGEWSTAGLLQTIGSGAAAGRGGGVPWRCKSRQSAHHNAALPRIRAALGNGSFRRFGGESRRTVMEAGASGLPVVSTKHAGIPDTVAHGETGLLSEEMDIDSMANHMALIARDPGLASTMGENARVRIQTFFSMERSIRGLYGILDATAKGKYHRTRFSVGTPSSELDLTCPG
jgi:colanic acid/amylovoran biosynthesis glycosyltransferase